MADAGAASLGQEKGEETMTISTRLLIGTAGCVLAGLAALPAQAQVATGDTSGMRIALSNSYAGNSWRQQMLETWNVATQHAIDNGLIAEVTTVNADGTTTQQASQLQNLILEGYDAILINSSSPTALNGAIQEACDAGIVVVVFDNLATAPCAYKVGYDYVSMGLQEGAYVGERLSGEGKVLEIRGIAGYDGDVQISNGNNQGLAEFPGIEVVAAVNGDWTQTVAQREVSSILPTLPPIDAVVTQGGDGWGTAKAFEAAGREVPLIIMGNRQDELALWKELHDSSGYTTMSISSTPGVASIAFWVAQQILAGKEVPNFVECPLLRIEQADLDTWLDATPEGGVATPVFTLEWTVDLIDAVAGGAKGTDLPAVPLPAEGLQG